MKILYKKFFIPLMLIDNNVYTFLSGILISLSTNLFTTLCFEKFVFKTQWHVYLATIMFGIAGALCIWLAAKMTGYQNYLKGKESMSSVEKKKELVEDVTGNDKKSWILLYLGFFISLILGIASLLINYILLD